MQGNCEYDNVKLLSNLRVLLVNDEKEVETKKEIEKLVVEVEKELSHTQARSARLKASVKAEDNESRPIAHIAGFAAKQIVGKLKCTICCNRLLAKSLGPCHSLIAAREYDKQKRSLTYCCEKFVEIVGSSLYYCDDLIEEQSHIAHLKAKITKALAQKYFLQWLISNCCS